jgi:Tol biopolymer transport system component
MRGVREAVLEHIVDGRIAMRSIRAQENIWVVGTDGSGLRPLTRDAARDRGPRWAADASPIYYSSRRGQYQFWVIAADGSGPQQITHGDLVLNHPIPSPDGRWVAAWNSNGGERGVFRSTADKGFSPRASSTRCALPESDRQGRSARGRRPC